MTWDLVLPQLLLNDNAKYMIWGKLMLRRMGESGIFNVEYRKFPPKLFALSRPGHMTPFILNGKKCFLDDWDYAYPTSSISEEFFERNPEHKDLKYVFKIQYSRGEIPFFTKLGEKFGIQIFPFFMFPRHDFELGSWKWKNGDHKYLALFSGRVWKFRRQWNAYMQKHPECISVNDSYLKVTDKRMNAIDDDVYLDILKQTKWGLCLRGKGTDCKNRREVEYLSYGMPLVLDYKPYYPFDDEFQPNKDYVYLEKPEDLEKLKDMDPEYFSERSTYLYKRYFDPDVLGLALIEKFGHLFP